MFNSIQEDSIQENTVAMRQKKKPSLYLPFHLLHHLLLLLLSLQLQIILTFAIKRVSNVFYHTLSSLFFPPFQTVSKEAQFLFSFLFSVNAWVLLFRFLNATTLPNLCIFVGFFFFFSFFSHMWCTWELTLTAQISHPLTRSV